MTYAYMLYHLCKYTQVSINHIKSENGAPFVLLLVYGPVALVARDLCSHMSISRQPCYLFLPLVHSTICHSGKCNLTGCLDIPEWSRDIAEII